MVGEGKFRPGVPKSSGRRKRGNASPTLRDASPWNTGPWRGLIGKNWLASCVERNWQGESVDWNSTLHLWEFVNKQPQKLFKLPINHFMIWIWREMWGHQWGLRLEEVELEVRALPQLHLQVPQCPHPPQLTMFQEPLLVHNLLSGQWLK